MDSPLHHPGEHSSNKNRELTARLEPRALRTYTPTRAVLAKSAGVYHWTAEGRRLYDFTSGVLVANLGHNPVSWMERFTQYMGWPQERHGDSATRRHGDQKENPVPSPLGLRVPASFFSALPMTAYNAVTDVETEASRRLIDLLQSRPGGRRLQQVFWAASGSEAIQKALWAALAQDRDRQMIIATRYGFHGKKGLAGAVTGCETDHDRDPRVRFVSFPMEECADVSMRDRPVNPAPYRRELDKLWAELGERIAVLITEPYLGGGGSF